MKSPTALYLTALCLSFSLIAGCAESSRPKAKTVDVSGTVYLDDQPLPGVMVFFTTRDHMGFGKTGPDGKYKLEEGAVPGENKVYFSKTEGGEAASGEPVDPAAAEAAAENPDSETKAPAVTQAIPAKYADSLDPPFTSTVPEAGATDADFKLTSQ